MNRSKILSTLLMVALIAAGGFGCHKKTRLTQIPTPANPTTGGPGIDRPRPQLPVDPNGNGGIPKTGGPELTLDPLPPGEGDRSALAAYTVYFDFDRSTIKASEQSKIEAVAEYMKTNAKATVQVEGHCDERGTEEYNRSLGERRSIAIRSALISKGINGDRVHTISYGEDRPAVQGHDDTAWSKNRRGEFVVFK